MLSSAKSHSDHDGTGYYREGFLLMQNLIMKAFLKVKESEEILEGIPEIFIQVRILRKL